MRCGCVGSGKGHGRVRIRVERNLFAAGGCGVSQLGFDDLNEGVDGLGAFELNPVDIEDRGGLGADLHRLVEVGVDGGFVLAGVEAVDELKGVEFEIRGNFREVVFGDAADFEKRVVVFPKLALLAPAQRAASAAFCASG